MIPNIHIYEYYFPFCNEAADMAAKESLNLDITDGQVRYTDLKCHINHFISNKWQER